MKLFSKLIFVSLSYFTSCQDKTSKWEKGLEGIWTIDSISYRTADFKYCLNSNTIYFRKDRTLGLPKLNPNCLETGKIILPFEMNIAESWKIEILKKNNKDHRVLSIKSNDLFTGKFDFHFYNDTSGKLLKIKLVSNKLLVFCRKAFVNYDSEISFIEELEKNSN
jgi:hypothetical protein